MYERRFATFAAHACGLALAVAVGCLAMGFPGRAVAAGCPAPAAAADVAVPGHPFAALATDDGCWLFVTLTVSKDAGAVAVLRNRSGEFTLDHVVALQGPALGAVLSPDGQVLAVTADGGVAVLDVAGLESNSGRPLLGTLHDGPDSGAVYAAISLDDRLLFVSDELARQISVFDFAKVRSGEFSGKALIGRVPTATSPVGLALSPDGKWLYATSEVAPAALFPASCKTEARGGRMHPPGLLSRIDVTVAGSDPARALVAVFQAGCNPVRVAVAPSGQQVWVTARGDDALLRFQASDLLASAAGGAYARFSIGAAPVGVAVRPDGKQVWVALSDRFRKGGAGRLAGLVLSAGDAATRSLAVAASGFPREVTFLPDGHTLVATLFGADRVVFVPTPP